MSRLLKWIFFWLPPIIWMNLIFLLSSKTRIGVSEVQLFNFIIFKTLHIIEYAILYLLLFRGFYLSINKKPTSKTYVMAFVIAVLYASSDEIHQAFIPTREGTIRDIFIDTIGISIMYILIKNNIKIIRKVI